MTGGPTRRFPFYARLGCQEIWLVTPKSRAVEVYALHDGAYARVAADATGRIRAPSLGLVLQTVKARKGPRLRIQRGRARVDV